MIFTYLKIPSHTELAPKCTQKLVLLEHPVVLKSFFHGYLAENHLVGDLEGKFGPIAPAQLRLVVLKARLLRPASKSLLEPRVCLPDLNFRFYIFCFFFIFNHLNHLLLDLLPNPGHPEEHCGQSLLQGGHQGALQSVPVGKVDGAEALGRHEEVHDVCSHV